MNSDFFASDHGAEIYYHPLADRLFIFNKATFLQLPCLEREDGLKMICADPYDVNFSGDKRVDVLLVKIGDL